jgi:hypothetical protein
MARLPRFVILRGSPVTGSKSTIFLYTRFSEPFDVAQDAFVGDAVC